MEQRVARMITQEEKCISAKSRKKERENLFGQMQPDSHI